MERLKRARGPIRASFTKTVTDLQTLLEGQDMDQVQLKLNKLERLMAETADLDSKVLDAMIDEDCSEVDYANERAHIEGYQDKLAEMRFRVQKLFVGPTGHGGSVAGTQRRKPFRLPKIELPKFNGDLKEWLGFWALFQKIHEDEDIEDSDKLHYLLQAMERGSRARDVVESYPQTAENYPKVIAALKGRFGREDLLVEVYVRELLKLVVNNVSNTKERFLLSKMYDQLESHLRALESLGVTMDKNAAMLFPMVESSLPETLLIAWQRSPLSTRDGACEEPPRSRLSFLMEFLKGEVEGEERISLARSGFGLHVNKGKTRAGREEKEETGLSTAAGLLSAASSQPRPPSCIFCERAHDSKDCFKAHSMTLEDKRAAVRSAKCCYICLQPNHVSRFCRVPTRCQVCGRRHCALMCPDLADYREHHKTAERKEQGERSTAVSSESVQTTLTSQTCMSDIALQTIMITVRGKHGERSCRALIDTGSQRSYILTRTATELGCVCIAEETIVQALFGGVSSRPLHYKRFQVVVKPPNHNQHLQLELLGQESICGRIPRLDRGPWLEELRQQGIYINDFGPGCPEVELLLGADCAGLLMTGRVYQLQSGLTAVETQLGWTVMGRSPQRTGQPFSMTVTTMLVQEATVQDLWRLEAIGIADPAETKSRQEAEEFAWHQFVATVSRENDGRYQVGLPWIGERKTASNMYDIAEKRLHAVTKKLEREGRLQTYHDALQEWKREGIIEEVPSSEYERECNYLPHRPVFKEESLTTKVRPVFDASCRQPRQPSLNQCLERGPNLLELIPTILLRFRRHQFGVVADIRKAFLMLSVNKEDRDFLRFLWWKSSDSDQNQRELMIYRHRRVVFGVNCSPFLLAAVIRYHLAQAPAEYRQVADLLLRSLYVDNCVTSLESREQLQTFMTGATTLLADAKLDLRMWRHSGDRTVVSEQPVGVLGLKWCPALDVLSFDTECLEVPTICSKRNILSLVQQIYDPLGLLSPATVVPKMLLQEAWAQRVDWDQEVPEVVREQFDKWAKNLTHLARVQVPRQATRGPQSGWSLHTFCDASHGAYAAAVFLHCEAEGTVFTQLLLAKARVAPLKRVTIPRLELLACTIGSRLAKFVRDAMFWEDQPVFYWSDSTTALAWIKRNDVWGTFVGNRVREILSLTNASQWSHVPGGENPADLPSRGCDPTQLLLSRWWEGPTWLRKGEPEWPRTEETTDEPAVDRERKHSTVVALTVQTGEPLWYLPRRLTYNHIVRTMAWVWRFIRHLRGEKCTQVQLQVQELESAERILIKLVQEESFKKGLDVLHGLRVCTDADGIIRVKTKITTRDDTLDFRLPALLPADHPFVRELIREEHVRNCHAGTQYLMVKLRERFWIVHSRRTIKSVIHKCVMCNRFVAKSVQPDPVPLPASRVRSAAIFEVVGVDMAGPLFLRKGGKVWVMIYTCAVYRAIHLELVTSASTDCFLQSLKRFVARRGRPAVIYSDNGSNFVGAENLFKSLDWETLVDQVAVERISWRFNPPTAAWWGGWWERLIRTVKGLLVRVLGKACLTYEELLTVVCQVEAVVNGRPLTYVAEDDQDLVPLTPSMFLHDNKQVGLPEMEYVDCTAFRKRFRFRQRLLEDLRQRFRREYLGQLVQRGKEQKKPRALSVGDVVLLEMEGKRRHLWPLARVTKLILGKDGQARVAHVRTATSTLVRPVQRLYPLEVMEEDQALFRRVEPGTQGTTEPQASGQQKLPPHEPTTRCGRRVRPPKRLDL